MRSLPRSSTLALAAVLAVTATHSLAQQRTTATYDDWTVRCTTRAGKPPQKTCGMEQLSRIKGKERPFSRVAISRPAKGQPPRLIVQVPVNVWVATGVKIQIGGKDVGLAGPFTHCVPAGCFAAITLKENTVREFTTAKAPARIVYANAAGRAVAIPLAFKGFAQAFEAIQKQ